MNTHDRRRRLLGLLVGLAGALAFPHAAGAATKAVDEVGTSFVPSQIDIGVNDKVVWTNRSSGNHTVTFDNGPDLHQSCDPAALLLVGCQGPGSTVERTFSAPGNYAYYCKFHGARGGKGMAGVVVVTAAGGTTSTTPASSTTTTVKASTSTTTKVTSSTTTTTRVLATSSTVVKSTTTTSETSSVLLPGDAPPFSDDTSNSAAGQTGGSNDDGSDSTTVALIVGLLLVVSAGGGYLLWRLRPGRA